MNTHKTLKFFWNLPDLILNWKKDVTRRINDDKNITINDNLSLCYKDKTEFAKAKVIWTKETTFQNLMDEDKKWHEEFSSDEEMYKTYSGYYKMEVLPETKLKVIKFIISI